MADKIGSYINGNYRVVIMDDGTKIRYNNLDNLTPSTAESIDLKITNRCDMGCSFCHEKSTTEGVHGDIMNLKFIDTMHPYMELAIGGGNPLEHPDLVPFLEKCKDKKAIPSMTVNQHHFMKNYDLIKKLVDDKLIYGLGISLTASTDSFIEKVQTIPNAVIHTICGETSMWQYEELAHKNLKVLILGYKKFGRGISEYNENSTLIEKKMSDLYTKLPEIIAENWFDVVSFDNLAITQLNPKRVMSDEEWSKFYMGDDGGYTFYVDAVNNQFGMNSCAEERYPIKDTLNEMFSFIQTKRREQ